MASSDTREDENVTSELEESGSERVLTRHTVGESLAKAGFGDVFVLSHEAADRVLTPARREIIEVLATNEVSSLRELAKLVDRNPGNLSRDMEVLAAENIIRYAKDGKAKRPELKHETIISEPLVATDAPIQTDSK